MDIQSSVVLPKMLGEENAKHAPSEKMRSRGAGGRQELGYRDPGLTAVNRASNSPGRRGTLGFSFGGWSKTSTVERLVSRIRTNQSDRGRDSDLGSSKKEGDKKKKDLILITSRRQIKKDHLALGKL